MNRLKILYVNYMLQPGHINFDQIQVSALLSEGHDVQLVMHRDIARKLQFASDRYALILPRWFASDTKNPLQNRFFFLLTLLYIKLKIDFRQYDQVIVSNTDEITLGLIPLCRHMGLICHANAGNFWSKVKSHFLHRLARHNFFIVFNSRMQKPFLEHGITDVFILSHGCPPPFRPTPGIKLPTDCSGYDMVIFHPSMNPDPRFINELITDRPLLQLLEEKNILLITHHATALPPSRHIFNITQYLPKEQYQQLFVRADIILTAYPESFSYQVSGVSYECVANGKKMLIRQNPSLAYCKDFFNYDPFFSNVQDLCQKILFLYAHAEAKCTQTGPDLVPDYSEILQHGTGKRGPACRQETHPHVPDRQTGSSHTTK